MARLLPLLASVALAISLTSPDPADATHTAFLGDHEAPWRSHVQAFDAALAARDLRGADRHLLDGYRAAVASRRWEGMVDVGDAFLRKAAATGLREQGVAQARQSYLNALFRARGRGSLDGTLRVAEAFAAIGDRPVVLECLRVADGLARDDRDRARVRALTARLTTEPLGAELSEF